MLAKTYIIHVSHASDRRRHIDKQLKNKITDVHFVLEGDKEKLSDQMISKYFTGGMASISGGTSCALKHILAYEDIKQHHIDYAIILEDDIFLDDHFREAINDILTEIKRDKISNFIISLEDSSLRYVKGSERKKGKFLYRESYGRMAGAYLIDNRAANSLIDKLNQDKCGVPIDFFHNYCADHKIVDIYWIHPTIATQGTLNGSMNSLIDPTPGSFFKRLSFKMHKRYKQLLWLSR